MGLPALDEAHASAIATVQTKLPVPLALPFQQPELA